jgi:alpha-glucosidase
MTRAEWWRGAVVYQIHPRSFFNSNADSVGDLHGASVRLKYVATLPSIPSGWAEFGSQRSAVL